MRSCDFIQISWKTIYFRKWLQISKGCIQKSCFLVGHFVFFIFIFLTKFYMDFQFIESRVIDRRNLVIKRIQRRLSKLASDLLSKRAITRLLTSSKTKNFFPPNAQIVKVIYPILKIIAKFETSFDGVFGDRIDFTYQSIYIRWTGSASTP